MLFEQRTYTLRPQSMGEYLRLYESRALDVLAPIRPKMLGFFASEVGQLNQVVSLWGYESYEERARLRNEAYERVKRPEFADFPGQVVPLLQHMESRLMNAAPFSPMR